jgi:predicted RNA-binding protein
VWLIVLGSRRYAAGLRPLVAGRAHLATIEAPHVRGLVVSMTIEGESQMQAWIVVGPRENFEVLRERDFNVCAFKSSRRKQSGDMRPGDRIVFYLTGVVQFGGIVEVTSTMFEDETDIGLRSEAKENETYPFRVATKPVVIPPPGRYVEVREVTDLLDKTRKLGPKKLGMAFRGNLHRISDTDYAQIEDLLRAEAAV